MTRSQRRIRARKLGELHSDAALAAIGVNTENPNRGKRHAARLESAPLEWLSAAIGRDEARASLVNHERYRRSDGRKYPDRRESDGSPSPASYTQTYGANRDWIPAR